jgi:hypothetical protein
MSPCARWKAAGRAPRPPSLTAIAPRGRHKGGFARSRRATTRARKSPAPRDISSSIRSVCS